MKACLLNLVFIHTKGGKFKLFKMVPRNPTMHFMLHLSVLAIIIARL